ncbi:uncharacterized protein LOC126747394 [Anthonomus grandis grandis]|uniref:uncharacterized protein LOC126747394 n=1 Tax=Anthonomus grandis grandis TaxID=2921223 RepID=UPI002164F81C|nr:uncharacterized protein LOC126747394 [Anthonomus grandis grandis]
MYHLYNQGQSSPSPTSFPGGREIIWESLRLKGIPESTIPIMLSSIQENTLKQYSTCYKKWWQHCTIKNKNPHSMNFNSILDFIVEQFNLGLSYSSLNSYRSAFILIFTFNESEKKILKRFFKGLYNRNPVRPRYSATWDPHPVLEYLSTLFPLESLSFKDLSLKLTTLLLLTSGQRIQTLSKITLKNIKQKSDAIEIRISDRIKTSGLGKKQPFLVFPYFKNKPELCIASTIKHYIKVTETRRRFINTLILTHMKPYRPASTQTISRWVKDVLGKSGIDTDIFKSHSVRHATTSAAFRCGLDIDLIRITAGWTEKSTVFNTFYNLPLSKNSADFSKCIINNCT